jgi:hypothetical protein
MWITSFALPANGKILAEEVSGSYLEYDARRFI